MSTPADHEGYLRAALHAAAESLEPRGDGLERIRARLERPRPTVVMWMVAARDELRFRAPAAVQDAFYRVAAELRAAAERFAPVPTPGKHRSRTEGWLRPLAAMAAVMFIVAAGTYVAIDASTAVSPSSSSSHPRSGGPGPAGHNGGAADGESPFRSGGGAGSAARSPSASPSCATKSQPQPSASPPPSPSPSASVSPSPSPSPSSPGPSDSPSDGSSPDAVSAIQLTAYVTVAATTELASAPAPCASRSSSPATPAASTDAGVTDGSGEPLLMVTSASQMLASLTSAPARPHGQHD